MADRIVAMHGGVVQQVGAPLELYDRPANLFVAGFIGSPAMNFLAGTWDADGGTRRPRSPTASPCRSAGGAASRDGAAVTLGIRPEHVVTRRARASFAATVELVEPTGLGIILHLRLHGLPFNVLTNDRRYLRRQRRWPSRYRRIGCTSSAPTARASPEPPRATRRGRAGRTAAPCPRGRRSRCPGSPR